MICQSYALSRVKSNQNMSHNRNPKEGRHGIRYENETEINRRNGKTVLYGKQKVQDENNRLFIFSC